MAARKKSKKTTSSKTKKTGPASSAKSIAKRTSKGVSSSSLRNRAGKSKPASNARVTRKASKTIRARPKDDAAKPSKRKQRISSAGTTPGSARAKRPAAAAQRKASAKSVSKTTRTASAAKASTVRARLKEKEAKLPRESRGAQESRTVADKAATPLAGVKPSADHRVHIAEPPAAAPAAKPVPAAVKVQKSAGPEELSPAVKTPKSASQRQGFKLNEFVVYPAHGVGQIIAIEEQEVAGFKLELFVINFSRDKLTLRVPTSKVSGVGMRKISDPDAARRSLEILTGRARVKRTMWSRRAQEYETKINSGDINAIAEVVRDLYRSEAQPEQSYSERQLYEAALDRMVREIAAVQKSSEIDALKTVEAQLQKGQNRTSKPLGAQGAASEIEQAA